MGHVVGACKVSPCGYGLRGVYIWVARRVRRGLLHKTACVALQSRDWFGFREGTPFVLGAGMGVEGGTSGHVVSPWGVVPRMRRPVLGTGGLVVQCWEERWVH